MTSTVADIATEEVGEEERDRLTANLKELDQYLGPYPYEK